MKLFLGFFSLITSLTVAQELLVTSGKLHRIENFKSTFVDARNIDVWLPYNYSEKEQYAVLYMQDGQMLFDAEKSWNKQSWEVDETMGNLLIENKIKKCIVVGIWNNNKKRHPEYFPEKAYTNLSKEEKEKITRILVTKGKIDGDFIPISDAYLEFLVKELKPHIDTTFSTKADRANTFICGSSMGGLLSLYAICEYPKVFGGAACLSTHWTGIYQLEDNPIPSALFDYFKTHLPQPKTHRIYFDYGNQTLDALYPTLQKQMDSIMESKGFDASNWETQFFDGADHSEKAWAKRLELPLTFLLDKNYK
jgi:enterochelin esterase-like enzyme